MSDYDSSGSSSDDSDEDLFDVCLPTQYPYRPPRVDPERYQCGPIPTLGSGPSTFKVRGFSSVAASQQWSPALSSTDALSSFLLYARRIHSTLSMSQLLDLVRESAYDLDAAQAALLAPMLEPSRTPDDSDRPWDEAAAKEEVRRVMAKMRAHLNIKQTALQIHNANASAAASPASMEDESKEPVPLVPAAAVAVVASTNERCEECGWSSSAQTATEAINSALNALAKGATNAQSSNGGAVAAPVAKGAKGASVKKEPAATATSVKKGKGKNAAASASASPPADAAGTEGAAGASASHNDEEDDADDGKEGLDEGAASDGEGADVPSAASPSSAERAHSPSFLYPWMACACASNAGTAPGAHEPSVVRIDVLKLRDIIQIVADAEHEAKAPPGTPPLPVMSANAAQWAAALATVSSAHLAVLQSLLCAKNEWLDRVRPVLNSISRAKDNQTLVQILELLRELEAAAPGVDSRERRKCVSIVQKVQEWRLQCQRMFKQAATVATLNADGMLDPSPQPQSQSQPASPPVALSLASLSLQLKECDRACGPVASDESVFLRTVFDYVFNFVRQVECMVACRIPEEDRIVAEAEAEEAKQSEAAPAAAAASSPSEDADMDAGEDGEEEDAAPARRVLEARASARNHAVLSRNAASSDVSPSPVPSNGVGPAVSVANDYPREAGTLPQKLLLSSAKLRLSRFLGRFAFHFAVPQVALLRREIDRAESWLSEARTALQRERRPGEALSPWIASLESLLEGVESLSLAVDPNLADPVVKGLKGRLWVAKVDQAFEVEPVAAPAAVAGGSSAAAAAANGSAAEKKDEAASVTKAGASTPARRGPSLQRVYDLLAEALEIPIPPTVSRYQKLESVLRDAQVCIDRSGAMLAPKTKAPLSEWQSLLEAIRRLPVHLDEEVRLERVLHNTVEWHRKVDAFLSESLAAPLPATSNSLANNPAPALALRTPHSLPFDALESLIHRTTGKNLALISDECANPADNSAGYAQLRLLLRVGRAWCQEVSECFKHLSSGSAGRKPAGGAAGAGANKKAATGGASATAHEHMDRYALMARLKQLLGLYTCRDAELEAEEEEESEAASPEAQPDAATAATGGSEAAKPEAAADAAAMKDSVEPARAASASPVASPPPAVSLPSTDAASWSWLSRYQLDPALFESLLPQLELKMADRLSDRLSLVSESLAMAWNALRGPRRCTLIELKQLVHQLQQSGELNMVEPLRTLVARLKLAQSWRSQVRKVLPPQYLQEVRRRHKRRRSSGRDSSHILPSPLHSTRAPRRTRKKATSATGASGAAGLGGFDGDHDESDADDDGAAHVSSIDQLDFSDEDEDNDGDERGAADQGAEGESGRRVYRAALIDLLHLQQQYQRFAQRRQQVGSGDGAGVPSVPSNALSPRPVTPSTVGGAAPAEELDVESLGLDLVDLDELEALQLCIEECTALQRKAIDTLSQPSCAALAAKLSHAQPLFNAPKLPLHLLSPAAAADAIRPVTPHTLSAGADGLSAEAEEASMSALRALLAEVDERDVCIAIPEIESLAHLSWVRDWIGQAQHTLALCHKAYATSAIANAAAAAAVKDEPVDAGAAAVAAAAAGSSAAAAAASFAAAVPPSEQVTLDSLVALLRAVRLQFGPEQYTPLVSHLQLLRAQQHARAESGGGAGGGGGGGGGGGKGDGDSEGEEEHEEEGGGEQRQQQQQQQMDANADAKQEGVKLEAQSAQEQVAHPAAAAAAVPGADVHEASQMPLELQQQAMTAEGAVKMELDQPGEGADAPQSEAVKAELLAPEGGAAATAVPAPVPQEHASEVDGGEGHGEDRRSPSPVDEFQLHPFLDVFRFDLQHLEFYLYELLNSSHKLRQLFERRLGTQHTNLLLGPPREELLMWVADAAEEAGINVAAALAPSPEPLAASGAGAAAAPGSGTAPSPPVAESGGYGLLATSRRLKLQRARERKGIMQRPVVPGPRDRRTTPSVYNPDTRNVQLASPLPVATAVPIAESGRKSEGGRAAGARKKIKTEVALDEEAATAAAAGVKVKRQRKSKLMGAAPAAAAAGAASAATAAAVASDSHLVDDSMAVDSAHAGGAQSDEEPDSTLYCLCQRPYTEGDLMISCDACASWFHTSCLSLSKLDIKRVTETKFICPGCARTARKAYKFRDKVPHHRKARARGPKLASLQALLAKMPAGLVCEEGLRAEAVLQRALLWARAAEFALAHPPSEQPQVMAQKNQQADMQMAQQIVQQQQQQASAAAPSFDSSAAPADATMTPAEVPLPTHAATATADAVFAAAAAAAAAATPPQPMVAAPHGGSATSAGAPPLSLGPTRHDVETILKMECQSREHFLRQRQQYTDELAETLRAGMGLPLELTQRRLVEDRIRLLLNLEKAERILLDNVTVPLLPNSKEQEAALERAVSAAAEADAAADSSAPPAAVGVTSKEREQVSLTAHARKHELKEIGTVHTELQKAGAAAYVEGVAAQDAVWPRFDAFVTRLQAWIDKTTAAMYKGLPAAAAAAAAATTPGVAGASSAAPPPATTGATLHALLLLQAEFKNHFLMVVCPTAVDLAKRIQNIVKWMPREKRALAKGLRSTQLWKLQLERVNECGISNSPYTLQIQAACARCEDWLKRLHAGMDTKQGPAFFRALLKEAQEGESPVLVDAKDIRLCEGFTQLYCLCQTPYQDGVFMIACDQCEDWFHETCVGLTQKVAEKIKNYQCPRCCEKEGVPYKYGATTVLAAPHASAPLQNAAAQQQQQQQQHAQQQQQQLTQQQLAHQQQQQQVAAAAAAATHSAPPSSAMAIPATTVSSALVGPSGMMGAPAGWPGMDAAMAGIVWPGGNMAQMMLAQQHAAQQHHHQQQQAAAAAAAAAQAQQAQPVVVEKAGKAGAVGSKKKAGGKPGPSARATAAAADDSRKRKRGSAAAAHTAAGEVDDGKKPKKAKGQAAAAAVAAAKEPSLDATAAALSEAASAAEAAGVVGPMSLAVLQHEHLMSVPLDAPPPRTAALYATLLYENLHVQVTPENSNVLWHLLNGYMSRMFDARLEEEILEAAKLVCGEQLLTDALLQVNPIYLSQVQLQWRQQQQQQANMLALQKAHAAGGAPAAAAAGHQPRAIAATPTPVAAPAAAPAAAPVAAAPAPAAAAAQQSDSDSESDSGRATARAKQKRKPKNHPRPALSAYKCFVRHLKSTAAGGSGAGAGAGAGAAAGAEGSSATLLQNLTALADSQGKSVNKLMSEKWRAMSKENRQHFEDEALAEKERFDTQMAKWNAKHGHALAETQGAAQAQPQPTRPPAAAAPAPVPVDDAVDAHDQEMADAEQHQAAAAAAAALPSAPAAAASVAKPGDAPAVLSPPGAALPAGVGGLHPYSAHLLQGGGGALKAGVVAGPSQAIVHASLPHPSHPHPHPHPHLMPGGLYPPAAFHSPAFQHYITHALQQQQAAAAVAHREQIMQAQAQQQQQQQPHPAQLQAAPASASSPVPSQDAPLPSLPVAEEPPHAPDAVMSVEAASVAAAAADASRAGETGLATGHNPNACGRGYGNSGEPSEAGLIMIADGQTALDYLRTRRSPSGGSEGHSAVDPARLHLFGRSLGGAVALHLAALDAEQHERQSAAAAQSGSASAPLSPPLAGVIVENTFASLADMVIVLAARLGLIRAH